MAEDKITEEMLEELEDQREDQMEDQAEDQADLSEEYREAYGSPEPDVKMTAEAYLWESSFRSPDTLRTTFLTEGELGRPLFTVRFILDMEDIAKFYIDPIAKDLGVPNKIAHYFWEKLQNITSSGMSNQGFSPLLSVTKKMDITRKKTKGNIENLKGGKRTRT